MIKAALIGLGKMGNLSSSHYHGSPRCKIGCGVRRC